MIKEKNNKYVKVWIGDRLTKMPLEDYLEIQANKYGFDSYEELRAAGYAIDIPEVFEEV